MTIAIDVTRAVIETAGIGRHIRELVLEMLKIDTANEYIIYSTHFRNSEAKDKVFNSFKAKNSTLKRLPLLGLAKEILWTWSINWLSVMGVRADVLYATSIFEAAPGIKIPQVLTIYDMTTFLFPEQRGEKLSKSLNARTLRVCKLAKSIISISDSTEKDLRKFINLKDKQITTIYPGLNKFKKIADKLPEGVRAGKYILAVGTVEPRKNLIGLFKAYELLDEKLKEQYSVVVAGGKGWHDENIYKVAGSLVAKGQIKFLGFVSDEVLAKLYKEAAVFVYPSLYEGFGFPIIEALSFGQAVVTSNVSSMPEAAGRAAVLADPKDVKSIAFGISKVLTDKDLRNMLVKAASGQAGKFSWVAAARETIKVLKEATIYNG